MINIVSKLSLIDFTAGASPCLLSVDLWLKSEDAQPDKRWQCSRKQTGSRERRIRAGGSSQ